MSFQIGNVVVPYRAALDIDQSFSESGGRSVLRTLNGAAVVHRQWKKLQVKITGRGWVPAGLELLDPDVAHLLRCNTYRMITSNGEPAFPPGFTAYRTDSGYTPFYVALMPSGDQKPIGSTWSSVPGAYMYGLGYYPELSVRIDPIDESSSVANGNWGWSLNCEEI